MTQLLRMENGQDFVIFEGFTKGCYLIQKLEPMF